MQCLSCDIHCAVVQLDCRHCCCRVPHVGIMPSPRLASQTLQLAGQSWPLTSPRTATFPDVDTTVHQSDAVASSCCCCCRRCLIRSIRSCSAASAPPPSQHLLASEPSRRTVTALNSTAGNPGRNPRGFPLSPYWAESDDVAFVHDDDGLNLPTNRPFE